MTAFCPFKVAAILWATLSSAPALARLPPATAMPGPALSIHHGIARCQAPFRNPSPEVSPGLVSSAKVESGFLAARIKAAE